MGSQSIKSVDSLSVAGSLISRHERLIAYRFIQVAETLLAEAPVLARISGFEECWSIAEHIPSGWLQHAVRQPLLDTWVRCAERLLRNRTHTRYPDAHPSRHLKSFAHLLLSWAHFAPENTRGRVPLFGWRTMSLLSGRLLVCIAEPRPEQVQWKVQHGVLTLTAGQSNLEVDLSGTGECSGNGYWTIIQPPSLGGLMIDVWTPGYCDSCESPVAVETFREELERALSQLSPVQAALASSYLRCITLNSNRPTWVAGLARAFGGPAPLTPLRMLQLVHHDRIARFIESEAICAGSEFRDTFVASNDLRTILVEVGARLTAAQELGQQPNEGDLALWENHLPAFAEIPGGVSILEELGQCGTGLLKPGVGKTKQDSELLDLREDVERAGIDRNSLPVASLQLNKARREVTDEMDWSGIDALAMLDRQSIENFFAALVGDSETREECAWGAAMSAYLLERFEDTVAMVRRCLKFDTNVEQYWLLLAFALRHLNFRESFEQIVFDQLRNASVFPVTEMSRAR